MNTVSSVIRRRRDKEGWNEPAMPMQIMAGGGDFWGSAVEAMVRGMDVGSSWVLVRGLVGY